MQIRVLNKSLLFVRRAYKLFQTMMQKFRRSKVPSLQTFTKQALENSWKAKVKIKEIGALLRRLRSRWKALSNIMAIFQKVLPCFEYLVFIKPTIQFFEWESVLIVINTNEFVAMGFDANFCGGNFEIAEILSCQCHRH